MRFVLILSMTLWSMSSVAAQQNQTFYGAQQDYTRAVTQLAAARGAVEVSPIDQNLFPPELVMRHRAELELTDQQRGDLIEVIQEFQSAIVAVEWELQDAKLVLDEKLAMHPTSEEAVEQALDNVFVHEAQIKKRHILMLVKVKNVLSRTQVDYLAEKNQYTSWGLQGHRVWGEQR